MSAPGNYRTTSPQPDVLARPPEISEQWTQSIAEWLAHCRAGGIAESSLQLRGQQLRVLARVAADPWRVTTGQLEAWLASRPLRPETRKSIRAGLRSFYRWAVAAGHVATSPADGLLSVRVPQTLPRPVTDEALAAALAACDDKRRLAVYLGAYAGLRRAEIAAVHPRDIVDGALRVRGKGGRDRIVPLHPILAGAIGDELTRRRGGDVGTGFDYMRPWISADGWLFPSRDDSGAPVPPDTIYQWLREVLPEGWSGHKLRHRFASRAYAVQRDLLAVQRLLGHSKPETTARYAAVPDDSLRSAVFGI